MTSRATTGPGPRHAGARKVGPKPVEASPEGWAELATHVRLEMTRMYKCDTIRDFVEKTEFPERTLNRVLSGAGGLAWASLYRLEQIFEWKPGTAMRYLQGPPPTEKPKLKNDNERKLWAALENIPDVTMRDRIGFLEVHRRHHEDGNSDERSG
jgi:hypothetical protein